MMLRMRVCVRLLWGISVLFPAETKGPSIAETTSSNSTAEPDKADRLLNTPPHDDAEMRWVTRDASHRATGAADSSTASLVFTDTATTSSVGGPQPDNTSPTAGGVSNNTTARKPETTTPSEDQSQQQSSIASTAMTSPHTASTATSPHPTSTNQPNATSSLFSSTSPGDASKRASQFTSSPSASTMTTEIPGSVATVPSVAPSESLPITETETSTANTKLSFHISPETATGLGSAAASPTSTGSNAFSISTSASATRIFIPHIPKRLPTTRSTPAHTAAPNKVLTSSEVKPCSNREMVKQSLIAIAVLAGLATAFLASTIVLCTKLSAKKYKLKRPQQATEMMCISSLLPERTPTYVRQRNPVTNGVLVIPGGGDSDEDGGDNLTLSSFLPENDRFV